MASPPEPVDSIGAVLRGSMRSRPRLILVAATAAFALLGAVGGVLEARSGGRVLAVVASSTHSLISVAVPFVGVLLVDDLRARKRITGHAFLVTVGAAVVYAVGFGLIGDVLSVIGTVIRGGPNAWASAPTILAGGLLVHVLAQLVGTGLGLLLRPPVVAMIASVILPLGVWFVLGSIGPLRPAQWFTPYAGAARLLSGAMTPLRWVEWLTTLLVWGVGLNVAAYLRRPAPQSKPPRPEQRTRSGNPARRGSARQRRRR